jgi:hypothetical protein
MSSSRSLAFLAAIVLLPLASGTAGRIGQYAPSEAGARAVAERLSEVESAQAKGNAPPVTFRVSESDLESYVMYGLRDELAVRLDSLDLEIRAGEFSATMDMYVEEDLAVVHPIVGPLFEGRHSVFFEGTFEGRNARGTFALRRVQVDGVTVPVFLVKAFLRRLDEPLDLDAPFALPIGIEDVTLLSRSASVTY